MTLKELGFIMAKAKGLFPNYELTPEIVGVWFELFHKYDAVAFQAAMHAAAIEPNREFFPTPGAVTKYMQPKEKPPAEIWERLRLFAQNSASLGSIERYFGKDSAIMRAVRAIGWDRVQYANLEKELPFIRKDFIQYLTEMRERENHNSQIHACREHAKALLGKHGLQIEGNKVLPLPAIQNNSCR
jgi:hypothetical protein